MEGQVIEKNERNGLNWMASSQARSKEKDGGDGSDKRR